MYVFYILSAELHFNKSPKFNTIESLSFKKKKKEELLISASGHDGVLGTRFKLLSQTTKRSDKMYETMVLGHVTLVLKQRETK